MSNIEQPIVRSWRFIDLAKGCQQHFVSNEIRTSRYTVTSAVPKSLFEQFQRVSNLWFLTVSAIQLSAVNSTPESAWTTVVPLICLLLLTFLRDLYLDLKRHRSDSDVNSQMYAVCRGSDFEPTANRDIKVGDLLLLQDRSLVPADILLLASGNVDHTCFVDKQHFHDNSNIELKQALRETQEVFDTLSSEETAQLVRKLRGIVKVGEPTPDFRKLDAYFKMPRTPKSVPIPLDHFVIRQSVIRATPWVIGLVVYTGLETKAYLSISSPKKKVRRIDRTLNSWVAVILLCLLGVVLTLALCERFVSRSSDSFLTSYCNHLLLLHNTVPITLFITIEFVRLCHAYFMQVDEHLESLVDLKSGDIIEDLGQVEYLLASKESLLDSDRPELTVLRIGDEEYWKHAENLPSAPEPLTLRKTLRMTNRDFDRDGLTTDTFGQLISEDGRSLLAEQPLNTFKRLKETCASRRPANYEDYFECLAVCNAADVMENGTYFSPWKEDELQVASARHFGCILESRNERCCQVNVFGRTIHYEVVAFSAFSETTRRTRIFVQRSDEPESAVYYVKGPFGIMGNIIDSSVEEFKKIEKIVAELNLKGIRTQLLAKRTVTDELLTEYKEKFQAAQLTVAREDSATISVFEELEYKEEVVLLGVVGISDCLSAATRETISMCEQAGVKVWLVSGDSEGATLAVAYQAGLISPEQEVVHLKGIQDTEGLRDELEMSIRQHILKDKFFEMFERKDSYGSEEATNNKTRTLSREFTILQRIQSAVPAKEQQVKSVNDTSYDPEQLNFGLSIDGPTFRLAIQDKECKRLLCYLLFCAHAVCCFSFLPLQKGLIAKLVKENFAFRPVTLAVGRTSNAIAMLQESDVGISISGKDSYSSHASDIVMQNFAQLTPLLFKHGQWNYARMTQAILLFLYRSMLYNVFLVWFSLFTDFSTLPLFEPQHTAISMYLLAEVPLFFFAVFDQHISAGEIPKVLATYQDGQFLRRFHLFHLLRYVLLALVQGTLLCALLHSVCAETLSVRGSTESRQVLAFVLLVSFVVTVSIQVFISSTTFTWLFFAANGFCCVFTIATIAVSDQVLTMEFYGVATAAFTSPALITVMCLGPAAGFIVGYALRAYSRVFSPSVIDKLRLGKVGTTSNALVRASSRINGYTSSLKSIYRSTAMSEDHVDENAYAIRPFSLRFASKYIETEYQLKFISTNLRLMRCVIVAGATVLVVWAVVDLAAHSYASWYLAVKLTLCGLVLCCLCGTYTTWYQRNHQSVTISAILMAATVVNAVETAAGKEATALAAAVAVCVALLSSVEFRWVVAATGVNVGLLIIDLIYYFQDLQPALAALQIATALALLAGVSGVAVGAGYSLQRTYRTGYKLRYTTEKEVEKSRHILSLMLPFFVINQVVERQDDKYIAEDQGVVTVVFCDIYDFDSICQMYHPSELVAFLDQVFQKFDDLCVLSGVVKIETVGKTYMACAGLKSVESSLPRELGKVSHPRRAVNFAFRVLQTLHTLRLKNGEFLQVKIGINSGPVISGVIGHHKPQFSLVGDTVNTASRMCSTIDAVNTIQISESVRELMPDSEGCDFAERKVWAKGKGDMRTLLVSKHSPTYKDAEDLAPLRKMVTSKVANIVLAKGTFAPDSLNAHPSLRRLIASDPLAYYPLLVRHWTEENQQLFLASCAQNKSFLTYSSLAGMSLHAVLAAFRVLEWFYYPDISSLTTTVSTAAVAVLFLCLSIYPKGKLIQRVPALLCIAAYTAMAALVLLDIFLRTEYHDDCVMLDLMFIETVMAWSGLLFSRVVMIVSALFLAAWVAAGAWAQDSADHSLHFFLLLLATVVNCLSLVAKEKKVWKNFHLKRTEEKEIAKNEKLLSSMMPKTVYQRLKQDVVTTDRFRSVTLLFADIVGFTNWSSDKNPQQVVGMLSALFTQFDNLCVRFKSYKVHTIGDCYVVMGYTGETEDRDPTMECVHVFCMGLAMIDVIQEVNHKERIQLNMRIGIHTGDVIAGISGKDTVRYDIYGPAVLLANKMESNGQAGKVNVSAVTRELLDRVVHSEVEYEDNKEVIAPSIGAAVMSYFAVVKDSERLQLYIADS